MLIHTDFVKALFISIAIGLTFVIAAGAYASEEDTSKTELEKTQEQVAAKEKEISDLEAKIESLKSKHAGVSNEAEIIAEQVARIQQQISKAKLELKRTELNIQEVEAEKKSIETQVVELQNKMDESRQKLRSLIRLIYEKEQESMLDMFFTSWSLSDVFAEQAAYKELQDRTMQIIRDLRKDEEDLNKKKADLESREEGLSKLQELLDAQQQDLVAKSSEHQQFLNSKKEQQVEYENLIADARQARDEIKRGLFTLKNSDIEMSLTDAVSMAKYAGKLTGVRPAILLGVLKRESSMGTNIGSGRYPNDMSPLYGNREAFVRITRKLGLDPNNTPVSAKPSYGWGGAMGPAQIMPSTWEGVEGRVANLMGKERANPYEMTDALVAMAIFLADRGAADPNREYEAINRYLAGSNWRNFTWYGDQVMAIAKEYEGSI